MLPSENTGEPEEGINVSLIPICYVPCHIVQVFKAVCSQLLAPIIILRQSPLILEDVREKLDSILSSLFSRYVHVYTCVCVHACL